MAPNQSRQDGGADLALRQQLAQIKRVPLEQVGRIRMTPEKLPSLVDVGVILTGQSASNTSVTLQRLLQTHPDLTAKCSQVSFGGRGGNRQSLVPNDLATLIEIIFLLPGRAAAQVRQEAAKIFVRYLGGDLRLIQEVEHLHHVQNFLREHAPEHPLRAFGEAVNAENATVQAKRTALDLLELDVREGELKARLELAQGQTKKVRIDTFVYCHEAARRLGVEPDDRTRLQLRDLVQSVAIPTEALPRKEICVRAFLMCKKANVGLNEVRFGKAVAALKRENLRAAGLSDELPTKTIYANGQVVQAKLYFDEDLPFFEKAWESIVAEAPLPQAATRRGRRARP